jgi:DNA-binding phage protein
MAIKTYPVDIAAELKTEEDIEGFIEAAIEKKKNDTDPKYLIHVLETAARARGMITTTKEADVDRANL